MIDSFHISINPTINYNMNIIWTSLVCICILVLVVINPNGVLVVLTQSATQALEYCVQLCAVYCVWMGILKVAERCGLVDALAKRIGKITRFLFGDISTAANKYTSLNLSANLLGVGNAATPSAISAIKDMERGSTLSRAGAMLFVLNASSIQLIPTTVLGLRSAFGSTNPSSVLLPTLITTVVNTVVGIVLVSIAYPRKVNK